MKHNGYYVYEEQGIFVLTEELRSRAVPTHLPWDLFQDHKQIAVGYIRWSDEKQNSGHSYAIQEQAIILKAKNLGFEGVVIFVEAARSAYHYSVEKRKKMKALKEFVSINTNANVVIFYDESRVTRAITDFYTG
ncbi:MAG: recombinase family protein, partial [Lysinibacillus sp.]